MHKRWVPAIGLFVSLLTFPTGYSRAQYAPEQDEAMRTKIDAAVRPCLHDSHASSVLIKQDANLRYRPRAARRIEPFHHCDCGRLSENRIAAQQLDIHHVPLRRNGYPQTDVYKRQVCTRTR